MSLARLDETLAGVQTIVSPVVLVGGSVRDALLDRHVTDYDLATPLHPDDLEEMIRAAGRRPYTVGKRFGTVGFRWNGRIIEVTTFRDETYRLNDRHPDVEFVPDLKRDLARRDLTINAMAYDGTLIDPFGGESDLSNGILRAVGAPAERMEEDPLRILRIARFASELGFDVEQHTLSACEESAHLILHVARQRWAIEMDRLITGPHLAHGMGTLERTGILHQILPLMSSRLELGALDLAASVDLIASQPDDDLELRWAALTLALARSLGEKSAAERAEHLVICLAARFAWSNSRTADTRSAVRMVEL